MIIAVSAFRPRLDKTRLVSFCAEETRFHSFFTEHVFIRRFCHLSLLALLESLHSSVWTLKDVKWTLQHFLVVLSCIVLR